MSILVPFKQFKKVNYEFEGLSKIMALLKENVDISSS